MACGKQQPTYQPPAPPTLPTAEQLFGSATAFGKRESPLAYGAREGALQDLALGPEFYQRFQPTSFENALSSQYFKNIYPDVEKNIRGSLSLSGIESSPILARLSGKAYGDLSTQIGEYLSNLGNERARYSLDRRLSIDPFSTYGNYLNTDIGQSNDQADLNYQYAQQMAMANYMSALDKYKQKGSMVSTIGAGLGGGAGFFLSGGNPGGAALGASLGGTAAGLFGGSGTPISFADALSIYDRKTPKKGYGQNTPYGTYDMGTYSTYGRPEPVYGSSIIDPWSYGGSRDSWITN